jgi:5-methylcytosine-specific restriction endonuclease McrA
VRRSPLRRVSTKRQDERLERDRVVQRALVRARWACEATAIVPEVECGGHLDVDEIVPRGVYPGGHLDIDNVQALCRRHHIWKHDYPEEAVRRGLRKWSWEGQ